jgi:hypothetical protein
MARTHALSAPEVNTITEVISSARDERMPLATTVTFDKLDVLTTCALRIDGYLWAVNAGLERHQLMRA